MTSQTAKSTCVGCGEDIPSSSKICYDCAQDDTVDVPETETADAERDEASSTEASTVDKTKHSLAVRLMESLSLTGIMLTLSTSMGSDDEGGSDVIGAIMLALFLPMARNWIEDRFGIKLSGVQFWLVTLMLGFVGYVILTALPF